MDLATRMVPVELWYTNMTWEVGLTAITASVEDEDSTGVDRRDSVSMHVSYPTSWS